MHPLKLVALIGCYLLLFTFTQSSTQAFWLTDGSLFQQPSSKQVAEVNADDGADVVKPAALGTNPTGQQQQQVLQANSLAIADLDERRETRPAGQSELANVGGGNNTQALGTATLATNRIDPWVRVADISSIRNNNHDNVQAAQTKANSQEAKVVNQVCQCSSDWLQNQTNQWLRKWMNSADFANILKKSIVSTSNAPSSRQALHRASQTTNGSSRSLAWNRTSKRNSNASSPSSGADGHGSDAKSSQAHRTASPDRHRNTRQHASNSINNNEFKSNDNNNKDHQYSRQPVKLVQGEQGSKCERGPPGERGPSALISVKDRDALFDLGPVSGEQLQQQKPEQQQQQQQQQEADSGSKDVEKSLDRNRLALSQNNKQQQLQQRPSGSRLAFIESEQMLVVETSIGWRPIPMLAPLEDFRKTIAKFSLNSAEDRRRLIMTGGEPSRQRESLQLAGLGAGRKSTAIYWRDSPMVLFANTSESRHLNNILNAIGGKNGVKGAAGDDEDDEEDEEEDDDDDDDDEAEEDDDDNEIDRAFDSGDKQTGRRKNGAAAANDDDDDDDDEDVDDDDDDEEDDDNEIGVDYYNDGDEEAGDKRAADASVATKARVKYVAKSESSKVLSTKDTGRMGDGTKTKRRRAQVSGLTGVSATAGAVRTAAETNSIASELPTSRFAASQETSNEDERAVQELGPSSRSVPSLTSSSQASPSISSTADEPMKLRLIALNEPFAGNQHGLRGANFECKRNAARANIKGAFRALLATNYQNLNEIIRYNSRVHKFPIVNLRGETLANSWHDLFKSSARVANPLSRIYSFDGRHVASDPNWPNKLVWHGAGNKFGQRDSTHNCDGWHTDSLSKFGFASPLHSPRGGHPLVKHQSAQPKRHANQHRRRFADAEQSSSAPAAKRDQEQLVVGVMGPTAQGNSTAVNRNRVPSSLVFEVIEKYPCRMPLIVLCIETVAQAD